VGPSDIRTLFNLANDPVYRSLSINTRPITWEEHSGWFERSSGNPCNKMYLFDEASGKKDVALVRIEFKKSLNQWYISIVVDSQCRGQGIGQNALGLAIEQFHKEHQEVQTVFAEVKHGNMSSLKIFKNQGFKTLREGELFLLQRILQVEKAE